MIELWLQSHPYDERGKQRGSSVSRSGWSASSPDCGDRQVSFRGPALPRGRTTLQEDTLEFGLVRVREIEL